MSREIALSISDLSAGYDGEVIINDIDLEIDHGDFFGLIGPNGGGKSTLLKAILGLIPPIKGSIRVYGSEPARGRKYIGYVPQYSTFDKDFPITVRNVVLMGRRRSKGLRECESARTSMAIAARVVVWFAMIVAARWYAARDPSGTEK